MPRSAGIPLIDLFELTDTVRSVLPQNIRDFVERFVVTGHRSSQSDNAVFHFGELQAISSAIDEIPTEFNIGIGTLSLPLLQTGIPFQLAFQRTPGTGNLEPNADVWRLDLSLDVFNLTVNGMEPAIYVPESGTTARHLVRDPSRTSVKITGSAVLRLEKPAADAGVDVKFIDQPDPLDPAAVNGAVATLTCTPPHFFIGGSEFGLSVGRLQFDFSESYSPPNVIERGQGPGWVGVAIREATFYAPRNLPGVGDLSGGVKNVLIGSPIGMQGELEIQFGRTAMDPGAFQFEQDTDEGVQALGISGTGTARQVTLEASQDVNVAVRAGFVTPAPPADGSLPAGALQDWTATWTWPSGNSETADASTGTVQHGMVLRVTPVETVTVDGDDTEFRHPEITYRFIAAGNGPTIGATVGANSFANVVHIGGPSEELGTITLTATSGAAPAGTFEWEIVNVPGRTTGATFVLDPDQLVGIGTINLREQVELPDGTRQTRLSRCRYQALAFGDLLIGCEAGVFNAAAPAAAVALAAVEDTFDLSDFHAESGLFPKLEQATLDPVDNSRVIVPPDGLARVTIAGAPPAVLMRDRHVQVLMDYDTPDERRWGELHRPAGTPLSGAFSQADLLAWAARYPGAKFVVVGRCDDIGSDSYNTTLANERAQRGRELLTVLQPGGRGTPVAGPLVMTRGEQSVFSGASAEGDTLEEDAEIALELEEKSEAVVAPSGGRLIHVDVPDSVTWPDSRDDSHEGVRDDYRRVDIYAVGGAPTAETALTSEEPTLGVTLRRSMVPANGRDPAAIPPGSPNIDFRVKLRVVWDSPTLSQFRDAVPTLAEAEFAWTPATSPLPLVDGEAVALSREVLTVFASWAHDVRTGYTRATLGIRSEGDPDGLISTSTKPLVAGLAFGPALLSGVDADTDLIGAGARIAALLAAVGFAESLLGDASKVSLISAALETEMRSISDPGPDMQVRVITDYVSTLHVDAGVLGIKTVADQPMKIRYKRVGIEFDSSQEGWERFGLVYDNSSMEIEDPGRWEIDGTLGSLLRIVEIGMGRGSFWVEGRIAIALEIGLLEITEAIIRLTFPPGATIPEFELRGFVLKVDIPGVIAGEGRLRIEDGGLIRAGVAASIIPVGIGADAALALAKPAEIDPSVFLSLYVGVQFSTPLPLAGSGLALYGFKGLFVMNGTRRLGSNPDPVGRELDWWREQPENKYQPEKDQFALGVGVVVGTLPDVSFCLSAAGMIVVAFPDPEVILGVDVSIVEVPDTTVSDEGGASGTITGLIVIDDEAVKLAVSAQYTIPKVLEVKVPFAAYFPYPGTGKEVYVRIGSDGQTSVRFGAPRYGEPVTLKLLPGTLDVRAWTYLMIEQGGLDRLGGDDRFSFDGFAVGFGAGWEISWKAGPIKLSASAKILLGFGTAPLMIKGGVFVAGELDLVVVSIAARGELILEFRDTPGGALVRLDGEFCGEVDLFFFSLSGCVGVSIGNTIDLTPPAPPSPVKGLSLTDRRDRIMGVGTPGTPQGRAVFVPSDPTAAAAVNTNNTVWPDTAPVLHFSHFVENGMASAAQFQPGPTPTQPQWTGTSELKYAFRLDNVELRRVSGSVPVSGDAALQSAWVGTPYRQPDASGTGGNPLPSEHEGPNLKLLDWNPWNWVVNLDSGGEGQLGDPSETAGTVCDPPPAPQRACVFGRAARRAGLNRVSIRQETPAPPPYPSRFFVTGEPVLRTGSSTLTGRPLQTLVEQAGGQWVTGAVVTLPFQVSHGSELLSEGYALPAARRVSPTGLTDQVLPWEARFDQPVTDPSVTLLVCDAPAQGGRPDDDGGDDTGGGDGGPDSPGCDNFRDVAPGTSVSELLRTRFRMHPIESAATLTLVDNVDQRHSPAQLGTDGSAEVRFPNTGAWLHFDTPMERVEISVMQFAGAVKAEALSVDGRVVDGDGTPNVQRVAHVLRLSGSGADRIAAVRLLGGSGEAVLFKVCGLGDEPTGAICEDFAVLKPNNDRVASAVYGGFTFSVIDQATRLRLTDAVDAGSVPVRPGSDGSAEVFFPDAGLRITLPRASENVELHVMTFTNQPVKAEGMDVGGNVVATDISSGTQRVPLVLTLRSPTPMTEVRLTGGGGEAALYRICRRGGDDSPMGGDGQRRCVDFLRAQLGPEAKVSKFTHQQLVFTTSNGQSELSLVDRVNEASDPDRSGRDRRPELRFGGEGLRIVLPSECSAVELKLMLFKAEPVKAQALDATGARVARDITDERVKVPQIIRLTGRAMRVVELFGGAGEAVLYEICCEMSARAPDRSPFAGRLADRLPDRLRDRLRDGSPPAPVRDTLVGGASLAVSAASSISALASTSTGLRVTGIVDDALRDGWIGTVIEQHTGPDKRHCQVITFKPRDPGAGPWHGFLLRAPAGKTVTLLSVCGVDQRAADARANDADVQAHLLGVLVTMVLLPPDERREIVLEPDTEYEVLVSWSYQAWQPASTGQTPPDTASGTWIAQTADAPLRFRTAPDSTATAEPQDGLNEFIFDARDTGRYLLAVEPADARGTHFTADPIWAHFDAGHVEQLLEQYGRSLELEVRRTDPAPQSTPAALEALIAPLLLETLWFNLPSEYKPVGYQRIDDALLEQSPCVPAGPVTNGASLAALAPLEPDADYDFAVVAPKSGDRPVVSATRFRTSRYADPRELIDALGYRDPDVSPFLPDDVIIPDGMALPDDGFLEGDAGLDSALAAIDAETLPLPTRRPRSYVMWRFTEGIGWQVEGLLVDSLEALKRERTVIAADGDAAVGTRIAPLYATVNGVRFELLRANANWTRVLLAPATPLVLPAATEHVLTLEFTTSTGAMRGARRLRHVPSLLEREGL